MVIWILAGVFIQAVRSTHNSNHSSPHVNCENPGNVSDFSSRDDASLILVSKFDDILSTYELIGKFDKPLSTVAGVLLHSAVSEDRLDLVRELLVLSDPNVRNRHGITPLYKALEANRTDAAGLLIGCGADPNAAASSGISLLHVATLGGQRGVVEGLLRLGADADPRDISGKTPLYYAVDLNRTDIVGSLVRCGADINKNNGKSLLHIAQAENRLSTLRELIKLGAKVDVTDSNGYAPLYLALEANYTEIAFLLIKSGADINFLTPNGTSYLHIAVSKRNIPLVDKILKLNGNISITDSNGLTPAHIAISNDDLKMINFIFENILNVNFRLPKSSDYPIHYAIQNGSEDTVKTLLLLGAQKGSRNRNSFNALVHSIFLNKRNITQLLLAKTPNASSELNYNVDRDGNKPIHLAVVKGCTGVVTNLLEIGADPNATNKKGKTPLYIAVENDNAGIIGILASRKADVNYKDSKRGNSLLHIALENQAMNAFRCLIELNVSVHKSNHRGLTPIFIASMHENIPAVRLLASKGADLEVTLANGDRPILTAVENSTLRTILDLIEIGAELEPENGLSSIERAVKSNRPQVIQILLSKGVLLFPRKKSLLHLAAEKESVDVIEMLLRLGMLVDSLENHKTPLWTATSNNKTLSMKTLISRGADINVTAFHPFSSQSEGTEAPTWSLLHEAMFLGYSKAAEILLEYGISPNCRDYRGWTPLHYAAVSDKLDAAGLLLEWGADVTAASKNGITPLDLVSYQAGREPMVALLRGALDSRSTTTPTPASNSLIRNHPPPYFVT